MMRFMNKIMAGLCLAGVMISTPAHASGAELWWHQGKWRIYKGNENTGCILHGDQQWVVDETSAAVMVTYNPKNQYAGLSFITNQTTSLPKEGEVKLNVVFLTSNEIDDGWGEREFGYEYEEETRDWTFTHIFHGTNNAATFLNDFAKQSSLFVVTENDTMVSGIKLEGSAVAVEKLRMCATGVQQLHPNDPFLRVTD